MPDRETSRAKKRKTRHFRPVFRMSRATEPPQQPPSSILSALVDEVLLSIIDQIDSRENLINLACTCARFQSLVEPYLWRSLFVTRGDHAREVACALDSREQRPSHVRELSIRYRDEDREGIEELNHFIGLMDKLRHLTIESPCPNNSEWHNKHFDGSTRIDYTTLLEAAVYPRAGLPAILPALQSLTLHGHGPDDKKFTFGRCAVVFLHPTLQRIKISCTNFDAEITHASISSKKHSTPLQSLTLIECNVNVKFLDVVLSLPKALKELNIGEREHVFEDCRPSSDPTTQTSSPLFVESLERQAHSLERLSHNSGQNAYTAHAQSLETGHRTLCNLTSLDILELDYNNILLRYLKQNNYPPLLKTIKIIDGARAYGALDALQIVFLARDVLERGKAIVHDLPATTNLDVRFSMANYERLVGDEVLRREREFIYPLSSSLKSRNARLRIFVHKFPGVKTFIPPYMVGEKEPYEAEMYDSSDFWCISGTNWRWKDDDDYDIEGKCEACIADGLDCRYEDGSDICIDCSLGWPDCKPCFRT
ncbi:unnamed protein product [Periconia digitata]|uniref:F-box domain-containing protein n=1 Tax=Periconia digitata TaxID=1303443 RepID=A0A9W4XZD1_9PLEO|nr:unnamed protein product [Periconia digitata]